MRLTSTFLLLVTAASGQTVSIVSGNGQVVPQHYSFEPLAVQVRNSAGSPLSGATVNWQVTGGNGQAVLGNFERSATSVTDFNGVAEMRFYQNPFPIFGTSFAQSTVVASASGGSVTFVETTAFTDFQSGATQVNAFPLSPVGPISGPSGSAHPEPLRIFISGYTGGPVSGVALTVFADDGSGGPAVTCATEPGQQPGTVLSDATGVATCQLEFRGQPGTGVYQARIGGGWRVFPAGPVGFTVAPSQASTLTILSGNNQNGTVGVPLPAQLRAQLNDPMGTPVSGATVVWDVPSGAGAISGATSSSDGSGSVWANFTPQTTGPSQVRVRLASNLAVQAVFTVSVAPSIPGGGGTPGGGSGGGGGAGGCGYTVSPALVTAPMEGISATVTVTPNGIFCSTSVTPNVPWIVLTSRPDVFGAGTVSFTVAPNHGVARTGTLTVGGQTITISQGGSAPTPCSANSVSPTTLSAPSAGASGQISLFSDGSCSWTAGTNTSWLSIQPLTGTDSATLTYTIHPNYGTSPRTGHFTISGQAVTVSQQGATGSEPERFAGYLHYNAFGRAPSADQVMHYVAALNGGLSRGQLATDLISSAEFRSGSRFVAALYVGLLNRDPDYLAWIAHRESLVSGAVTHEQLAANLLNAEEFRTVSQLSDPEFVSLLYRQVLRRMPSQSELDGMLAELQSGTSRAQLAVRSVESAEFQAAADAQLTTFSLYATVLQRRPSPFEGSGIASQIQSGASVPTLASALLNGPEFQSLLQ